jgi:hypothetical protein
VRLTLAGPLLGIVHDRRRMREAQVNLAIRWFIGYGLHEAPPERSSLTRIRQRWGAERFRAVPARTAQSCVACGGHRHGRGGAQRRHAGAGRRELGRQRPAARRRGRRGQWGRGAGAGRQRRGAARPTATRPRSLARDAPPAAPPTRTRPWSRTARPAAASPPTSSTRPWTAGPGWCWTSRSPRGRRTRRPRSRRSSTPSRPSRAAQVRLATMDAAYAITRVFAALEGRAVEAVVPTKAERPPRGVVPVRRFKLDGRQEPDRTLPAQTHPAPARQARPQGIPSPPRLGDRLPAAPVRCARPASAARCRAGPSCCTRTIPPCCAPDASTRDGGARALHRRPPPHPRRRLPRRGQDLARARPRRPARLSQVRIQAYLTAAVINLKRLAAALVTLSLAVLLATRPMLARHRT